MSELGSISPSTPFEELQIKNEKKNTSELERGKHLPGDLTEG